MQCAKFRQDNEIHRVVLAQVMRYPLAQGDDMAIAIDRRRGIRNPRLTGQQSQGVTFLHNRKLPKVIAVKGL